MNIPGGKNKGKEIPGVTGHQIQARTGSTITLSQIILVRRKSQEKTKKVFCCYGCKSEMVKMVQGVKKDTYVVGVLNGKQLKTLQYKNV
jgi:predicted metal-binding protein